MIYRTFYYYKDKYALQLLQYAFGRGEKIYKIKKSKWGFLLDKPLLKNILTKHGKKSIGQDEFLTYWPEDYQYFHLSFDHWGEYKKHRHSTWRQTSRPGHNLVLQLNFNHIEISNYFKCIFPNCDEDDNWNLFHMSCHPAESFTMAWARLDLDFSTGELLIEEIQNDSTRSKACVEKGRKTRKRKR